MAGADGVDGTVGLDRERQCRRETARAVPLGAQQPLESGHDGSAVHPGRHQRAPGDPKGHAQRCRFRAVAGHVADHDVRHSIGCLHHVVEVAAQQRAGATGPVRSHDVDARRGQQQRRRLQTTFQAGVLIGVQAYRLEFQSREFPALALDRVHQGAAE
jgi:hypothetical protein